MSDFTKTAAIDDLLAKTTRPNHLASRLEKHAAKGAALPSRLANQVQYLQHLSRLVKQALAPLFPAPILADCLVVKASTTTITLSFTSPTAVNHARYIMVDCVQALRAYDPSFCQLQTIFVILSPKSMQSDARPSNLKRTLSENTKATITQSAAFVTHNDTLKAALLALAEIK